MDNHQGVANDLLEESFNILPNNEGRNHPEPQHALRIFPKKVWRKVFANLKNDPASLQNLSETCRVFHRILQEMKMKPPSFLVEFVKLIQVELHKIAQLLAVKIADFIECLYMALTSWLQSNGKIILDKQRTLERARQYLENNTGNQVITKLVIKTPPEVTPEEETLFLWNCLGLLPLLENNLNYVFLGTFELQTYVESYDILRMLLTNLPKLKEVITNFGFVPVLTRIEERERVIEFNKHVANNPLPVAPCLTELNIGTETMPLAYLVEIAARYGWKIKKLHINHENILDEASVVPDMPLKFPRLERLSFVGSFTNPGVILHVKAPSLETLWLLMADNFLSFGDEDEDRERIVWEEPLEQVLQILDNFSGITNLSLVLDIGPELDRSEIIKRNLDKRYPSVGNLNLVNWSYRVPLWFFANLFPNLEYLSVKASIKQNLSEDMRVLEDPDLFLLYQKNLDESGLWRKLPRLDCISCEYPVGPARRNGSWRTTRKNYYRPKEIIHEEGRSVIFRNFSCKEVISVIIFLLVGTLYLCL